MVAFLYFSNEGDLGSTKHRDTESASVLDENRADKITLSTAFSVIGKNYALRTMESRRALAESIALVSLPPIACHSRQSTRSICWLLLIMRSLEVVGNPGRRGDKRPK